MNLTSDGDQLELDLFRGVPWNGHSPRGLTRGHLAVILKARAEGSVSVFVDREQLLLWPELEVKARRHASPSAPLLLPLPWEDGCPNLRA